PYASGDDKTKLGIDFNQLDYDCFSMHVFAVYRTSLQGFAYGDNILATLLFFVPRALWPDKPNASSLSLGNYLMEHHSGWFENLSCPPFGDAYMDFGLVGALGMGVVFGVALHAADRVLDTWSARTMLVRGLAVIFIGFVPILLR